MALLDSTITAAAPSEVARLEDLLRADGDVTYVLFADKPQGDGPVVAAVDASAGARSAARVAKRIAEDLDAELTLVQVPRASRSGAPLTEVRRRRRTRDRIRANARRVTGHSRVVPVAGEGSDEERLLKFARARGARLLVTHLAERGLDGWLADGVAAAAPAPVVVVSRRPVDGA